MVPFPSISVSGSGAMLEEEEEEEIEESGWLIEVLSEEAPVEEGAVFLLHPVIPRAEIKAIAPKKICFS